MQFGLSACLPSAQRVSVTSATLAMVDGHVLDLCAVAHAVIRLPVPFWILFSLRGLSVQFVAISLYL